VKFEHLKIAHRDAGHHRQNDGFTIETAGLRRRQRGIVQVTVSAPKIRLIAGR
jgi:hypothetical protein